MTYELDLIFAAGRAELDRGFARGRALARSGLELALEALDAGALDAPLFIIVADDGEVHAHERTASVRLIATDHGPAAVVLGGYK